MIPYERSFISSDKAVYWSSKNESGPRNVYLSSRKKFWLECDKCKHSFKSPLYHINKGTWCPYCAIPSRILCENTNCRSCFERSFANSDKAKFWSNKNELDTRKVSLNCNKKFWFDCNKCEHSFETSLSHISKNNRWCPYCSNNKLCESNDCKSCFEKSFASSNKSSFWSSKNIITPRDISISSGKKFWFDCNICNNAFDAKLNNITNGNTWCPICKNKTESKLYKYLLQLFPDTIHQKTFEWCKHAQRLPFDFYIPSKKLIIELDGPQHYTQVSNWISPLKTQIKDAYKTRMAKQNGIGVIRVLQEDVWNNKNNWNVKMMTQLMINCIHT